MHGLLDRMGRAAARWHWPVIAGWLVVVVVALVANANWGGTFVNDYTVPGSQSQQGFDLLQEKYPAKSGYPGQIVFHAHSGAVADQEQAVDQAVANLKPLPDVVTVTGPFDQQDSPLVSKDGTIAYATISWSEVPASLGESYLERLDTAVEPARKAGLQVEYGGGAGQIGNEIDDRKSEAIGLALAFVLLFAMFASVLAAAIPLVSALFSVLAGLSVVGLLAAAVTFPTTATTVAALLGLGVAIDYGLFLVARHRENLDRGSDLIPSIGRTAATSGSAIVIAGGTVVVAILGLHLSGVPFVSAMGTAAAIVVAITMVAALTLVPAFLGVAGGHIRSLSARRSERRAAAAGTASDSDSDSASDAASDAPGAARPTPTTVSAPEDGWFARWGRRVADRPWPWGIAAVVVLLVLTIPLFSIRLGQIDASSDPTSDSVRRAYDLITEGFGPGYNGPLQVVVELPAQPADAPPAVPVTDSQGQTVQPPAGLSAANQQLLGDMQKALAATPGVAAVPAPSVNPDSTVGLLIVVPTTAPQDAATTDLVHRVRDEMAGKFFMAPSYVAGTTPGYVDFTAKIAQRLPWLILAVVALAFLLLLAAFRSIWIPTKAAILNLLSLGAAYGVVVAVFQWGWGSALVGIPEPLPIPAYVPMLMFAIIFGLSMDYEVFLLSRVHEAYHASGDARGAVAVGIGGTARVITTAAAVMVAVFLSFVLNPDPSVKMLAVGMAVAVLVDASIVRMVLVPSVMSLLGDRAWYLPRWLDRVVPNLDIEGSAAEELGPGERVDAEPAATRA